MPSLPFEQCPRCERLFASSRRLDYHLETDCVVDDLRPTEDFGPDAVDRAGY
jgi:hypothetical protein